MNRYISQALSAVLSVVLTASTIMAATPTGINPAVDIALPNFANSPNLRKFVDSLPGLGAANQNNLGQYIPIANPDTTTYAGSDFYEIGLLQYQQRMHSDLPAAGTKLRGYYQKNAGTVGATDNAKQYLGPLIIAKRDRPVRIKFVNELGINGAGNLPLPVDMTVMGAGMGPQGGMYTQNRADIHLHGGFTPWISDGTPHQWVTPAGDATPYKKGASFQNVPDMVGPGKTIPTPVDNDGMGTYYYPNQQSGRLLFYHDHSYGITRLNVYAGEAAGYLITDQVEEDLISGTNVSGVFTSIGTAPSPILPDLGGVYRYGIPLIIQDKSFINDATTPPHPNFVMTNATPTPATQAVDPLWYTYVSGTTGGDLWFPHEYLPNENIYNTVGFNDTGRWDYAPWMIPPMTVANTTLPSPTIVPEAFMDTPIVNGTAFPFLELPPTAVRFRILNACNDRMLNLQLYKAEPLTVVVTNGGTGYAAPVVTFSPPPTGVTATGTATVDKGVITGITVTDPGSGYTAPPAVSITDTVSGTGAAAYATVGTEVKMVEASPNRTYPPTWPVDGRPGGVPDPATAGPSMLQIGNETGFLAKVAVIPPQPVDFDYNRRSVTFGGVTSKSLYLPPAVRADVIVDLSGYKDGDTLILYNDAPAPMPLFDTRYDYFTDDPDQTLIGGAPTSPAGFGPNTRTVMQIRIKGTPTAPYNVAALQAALPKAFATGRDQILVPASAYNAAYGANYPDYYANAVDYTLNVTGTPQPLAKVITELPGFGYTTPPTVNFYGGGGTGAAAVATLNGVTGLTLTAGGSGYTAAPNVSITGGGGTGATAVATVSGGVVTTVTITNLGSNYTTVPTVNLTGGGGTGATATAIITLGSIGSITLTNAGTGYTKAPYVYLTGGGGTGATAAAMLVGDKVLDGKNLVEGFDMEFGRMNAVLGSTPNPLTPTVGAGPFVGANFYVDPPTEILKAGETSLWRISHVGVDSHSIHFHLFDVQVINRVDWTNTIKPPYEEEFGWKETIRTNPFEDIIVALRPKAMNLPFALPDSNRLLDPTSPLGSTAMFQPAPPPPGVPAVAQISNVVTNYGWEYVWHCHLLGHEENDMMRPIVLLPGTPVPTATPTALPFGNQLVATTSAPQTVTLSNTAAADTQALIINTIGFTGANAGDFAQTNTCGVSLPPGASCTISVTFTPAAQGARAASLAITSGNAATRNVPVTGTGTVPVTIPVAGVSPTTLQFGNQAVNFASASQSVTLSNTGNGALAINSIGFTGANAGDFAQTNTCGTSLAAGGNCTISVTFTPVAAGARAAALAISSNDPVSPTLTVSLSGTGVDNLPAPWTTQNLGAVGVAGSAGYLNGTFTIKGSGADIWGTADGFRYVYQPLAGDGTIVARVASVQNTNTYAKAGVMIRESLTANSRHAMVDVTAGSGTEFSRRLATGGSTAVAGRAGTAPYWVKLVRTGSTFTGYVSSDGVTWTLIGSDTITMANTAYIGLVVTSHNNAVLCTAVLDSVSVTTATPVVTPTVTISAPVTGATYNAPASIPIVAAATAGAGATISKVDFYNGTTLIGTATASPYSIIWNNVPGGSYSLTATVTNSLSATATSSPVSVTVVALSAPWLTQDVGTTGIAGSGALLNGIFTLQGSGADIWGTADGFRFVYQPLTGNGQIVARVASLQNTNTWAKGGVMIREALTANSRHAMVDITPAMGSEFSRRLNTGGTTTVTAGTGTAPYWVKLVRSGSTFTGYVSSNGTTWTQVGTSSTITMANTVYIGMVVTSHNNAVLMTSTFDGVAVTALP